MVVGVGCTVRFVWSYHTDPGQHLPALLGAVLAAVLAVGLLVTGLLADGISANRRLLEDALYHLKTIDHERASAAEQRLDRDAETVAVEAASGLHNTIRAATLTAGAPALPDDLPGPRDTAIAPSGPLVGTGAGPPRATADAAAIGADGPRARDDPAPGLRTSPSEPVPRRASMAPAMSPNDPAARPGRVYWTATALIAVDTLLFSLIVPALPRFADRLALSDTEAALIFAASRSRIW